MAGDLFQCIATDCGFLGAFKSLAFRNSTHPNLPSGTDDDASRHDGVYELHQPVTLENIKKAENVFSAGV